MVIAYMVHTWCIHGDTLAVAIILAVRCAPTELISLASIAMFKGNDFNVFSLAEKDTFCIYVFKF